MYDIRDALDQSGEELSPASISAILMEQGLARLPRRRDRRTVSNHWTQSCGRGRRRKARRVRAQSSRTKVGGLFLFLPYLAKITLKLDIRDDAKFSRHEDRCKKHMRFAHCWR